MAKSDSSSGEWRVLGFGVLVGIAVVALLVAAYAIGASKGRADARKQAGTAGAPATTAATETSAGSVDQAALATFASTCGGCHTLAAAGTSGMVGPNLDELKPTKDQVLAAIRNGGLGTGQMPKGLLTGAQAEQVAAAVSGAAGR